jgi:hypothetical protein
MTKRNKKTLIKTTMSIPIIIKKCNCGDAIAAIAAIANTVEGSIGCHRYPACCDDSDEDYEII